MGDITFGQLSHKINQVEKELGGPQLRRNLEAVGKATIPDVAEAVRGDLGDMSMSGWRRGSPFDISGAFKVISDNEVEVVPTPRGRGPMRVLEQGRNQSGSSGMAGPGVSADGSTKRTKSGGVRKTRARKSKRWNGRTDGKTTWSDAEQIMARNVPARVHEHIVLKPLGRIFSKG